MNSGREATRQTWQIFRPKTSDYRDTSLDDDDTWDFVGEEGRGDQPRDTDPDPWFKNHIMSGKARSIERNLGID